MPFGRNRESRTREAAGRRNLARSSAQEKQWQKKGLTGIRNQVRIGTKARVRSTSRADPQQQLDQLAKAT